MPHDWDMGFEGGGHTEEEEKFALCESIGHRPLRGHCPKKELWGSDSLAVTPPFNSKRRSVYPSVGVSIWWSVYFSLSQENQDKTTEISFKFFCFDMKHTSPLFVISFLFPYRHTKNFTWLQESYRCSVGRHSQKNFACRKLKIFCSPGCR